MRPAGYDRMRAALGCVDALRESVSALRPQELLDAICGIEVLACKTQAAMLELIAGLDAAGWQLSRASATPLDCWPRWITVSGCQRLRPGWQRAIARSSRWCWAAPASRSTSAAPNAPSPSASVEHLSPETADAVSPTAIAPPRCVTLTTSKTAPRQPLLGRKLCAALPNPSPLGAHHRMGHHHPRKPHRVPTTSHS
jgi:hypothetical protein